MNTRNVSHIMHMPNSDYHHEHGGASNSAEKGEAYVRNVNEHYAMGNYSSASANEPYDNAMSSHHYERKETPMPITNGIELLQRYAQVSAGAKTAVPATVTRNAPRILFQPHHALIVILILVALLTVAVTLCVKQGIAIWNNDTHGHAYTGHNNNIATFEEQRRRREQVAERNNATPEGRAATENLSLANETLAQQGDSTMQAHTSAPSQSSSSQRDTQSTMSGSALDHRKININTATREQLTTISGIGPALAEKIVAYRTAHGKFHTIDNIVNVPGIGRKMLEKIRNHIVV